MGCLVVKKVRRTSLDTKGGLNTAVYFARTFGLTKAGRDAVATADHERLSELFAEPIVEPHPASAVGIDRTAAVIDWEALVVHLVWSR